MDMIFPMNYLEVFQGANLNWISQQLENEVSSLKNNNN